jgi:hypothetical protein
VEIGISFQCDWFPLQLKLARGYASCALNCGRFPVPCFPVLLLYFSEVLELIHLEISEVMAQDQNKDPDYSTAEVDRGSKIDQPTAPDQFDERYRTTRMEIWAYYACVDR